ncbi:MAG: low-complexity tail membrane protein [Synechococcus sp.]|nr:low-complexity tail membrane protein [Synechococcus sp.]
MASLSESPPPFAMPPRSEPLLWIQLLGAGLLPLEALLLLLLLAGADPGPLPGLERLLCWGLGGLATTLLLWRRPADVWSLLLIQTPVRARRPLQQRLSRLQEQLLLRIGLALLAALSLPLLWWLDEHAAVAAPIAPLAGAPRLVVLILAAVLLAVMLWQGQQLLQALWLLSRSPEQISAARPLSQAELEEQRICLGLPLLLLNPLPLSAVPSPAGSTTPGRPPADVAAAAGDGPAVAAPAPARSPASPAPTNGPTNDPPTSRSQGDQTPAAEPSPRDPLIAAEPQSNHEPTPAPDPSPAAEPDANEPVATPDELQAAPDEPGAESIDAAAADPAPEADA